MRRTLIVMSVTAALLVASCGSSTNDGATTGAANQATPPTTAEPATPSGPLAPDFTLALAEDGTSTFTLSQEVKPVYMVFWAEW